MDRTRRLRWLWTVTGMAVVLALAAVAFGVQRAEMTREAQTAISLNAPTSFPVDI